MLKSRKILIISIYEARGELQFICNGKEGQNEDLQLWRKEKPLWTAHKDGKSGKADNTKQSCGQGADAGNNIRTYSISRIEIGTRFVTDYELKIFAKVLGVSMEWLTAEDETLQ